MLNEAVRLGDEGKYSEALTLWQALSNLPGLDTETKCVFLLNQRRCYSALGQHTFATETLSELERIDTTHQLWVQVKHARIDDLRSQGKFSEAYKELLRFRTENADGLANPKYADLLYEGSLAIAYHLINQNKPAEGLEVLNQIVRILEDKDRREANYYRGLANYQLGEWDVARDEFMKVLECDRDDAWSADAHYVLGRIYENNGALAWAKQHLEKAETLKALLRIPATDLYMALSNVCVRLGDVQRAKRYRELASS